MDDALVDPFLEEADEKLQEMNEGLLRYEKERDADALNTLFRGAHTLKGSSATMDFDSMAALAHRMEDVFDALREGVISADDALFDLLYAGIDMLEEMVEHVRDERDAPDRDVDGLLEKLERASTGEPFDDVDTGSGGRERHDDIQQIRVDVDRLDTLMNAVGELMITQKKLQALADRYDVPEIGVEIDKLERLSGDIRHEVSQARMVPISQVFDRFPRAVRDIAHQTGKDVSLAMNGGEIRMDRSIVERLGEPVIHLLRNAVDHGIEPPEIREEQGKPVEGTVALEARREGNEAVISVSDDGAGIDIDAICDRAVEQGVVSAEEARQLDRNEVIDLLFDPDFSTVDEVSELSGRGVGMSVVKETAERLHGSYSVETTPGEGTTIQMRLPLSLAVVRCFIVQAGDRQFGVPINTVRRCLPLEHIAVKKIEQQEVIDKDYM